MMSRKKRKQLEDIGHVLHIPANKAMGTIESWLLASVMGKILQGSSARLDPQVCKDMVASGELVKLKDDEQTGGVIYRLTAAQELTAGSNPHTDQGKAQERDLEPVEPDSRRQSVIQRRAGRKSK